MTRRILIAGSLLSVCFAVAVGAQSDGKNRGRSHKPTEPSASDNLRRLADFSLYTSDDGTLTVAGVTRVEMIDDATMEVELAPAGDFSSDLVLNVPLTITRTADDEMVVVGVKSFRLSERNLVIVIERNTEDLGGVASHGTRQCRVELEIPSGNPLCVQLAPCSPPSESCGWVVEGQNNICDCTDDIK